jgi:NAD(P)-dependent dehydrogenase (short-subunit alcohol dehydrogenase family)
LFRFSSNTFNLSLGFKIIKKAYWNISKSKVVVKVNISNEGFKMKNKIVVITGANRGIGKEVANQIAASGAKVYMACRSIDSANSVKDEIIEKTKNKNIFVKELDLSSIQSIKNFAESFKKDEAKLDILINNAGIMSKEKRLNNFGVEQTFAVNVLGHHYLIHQLVDLLKNARPSRIINVASDYAGGLDLDDINFERRSYDLTSAYKQSKQANRMLTRSWAKHLENDNIYVYSMTPGFVPQTDLFREQSTGNKFFLNAFSFVGGRSVKQGADTIVWLATSEKFPLNNGGFFKDRKEVACVFSDPKNEEKLWDICEKFLKTEKESK